MFTFWVYVFFSNIVIKLTFSIVRITYIKLHIRLHFFLFVQSNRKIHNYLCNYLEQCIYYRISSLISLFSCQTQAPCLVYHLLYFTLVVLSFFNLVTIFPFYFCLFLCSFLISSRHLYYTSYYFFCRYSTPPSWYVFLFRFSFLSSSFTILFFLSLPFFGCPFRTWSLPSSLETAVCFSFYISFTSFFHFLPFFFFLPLLFFLLRVTP